MRLGTAKNFSHTTPEEWAKKHAGLGLRAVVFPLNHTDDPALIREYVAATKRYDLVIAEIGVWRSLVCANEEMRRANIDFAVEELRFADMIGARCCVDFIGTYRGVRTEDSAENFTEEAFYATVETVREVIRRANPRAAKFALEAMRNSTPYSPEQYLKLYEAVDDPAFGIHLDLFNWISDAAALDDSPGIIDRSFDLLGDKTVSCHLKDLAADGDGVREVAPLNGKFDVCRFFERLKKYPDMPVIIEHLQSTEEYLGALSRIDERFGMANL